MTSKYKLVSNDKIRSMKRKIDTLTDENKELKKRIIELESERTDDNNITNVIEKKVHETLNGLLRDHKCPKDDRYKPHLDDDWSYDPERDGLDWSYRPKRGTDGRPYYPYPWPYAPEVGDWPPGPQIGDIPPGHPYWSIYPPNWPYYPREYYSDNTIKTSNGTGDAMLDNPYTTSKTEE